MQNESIMRYLVILFLAALLSASCHGPRKITTVVAVKDTVALVTVPVESDSARLVKETFEGLARNRIDYRTFSAKIKVDYKDSKDKNLDFNAFVRMRKDSVIWVSIIAALGVEAFRLMITPDSVVILDKLEKTVQYSSISELQKVTQLPFDFSTLQELIIGNPVYMEGELKNFKEEGELLTMSMMGKVFKHLLTFTRQDFTLRNSKLDDLDLTRSRTAKLAYEDYQPNGSWKFAGTRRLTLAEKNEINVVLEFKQVEFDQPQTFPFSIPKNYKLK
jgi:hypothetical protein